MLAKEKLITNLIVLKAQYETEINSIEAEAKASYLDASLDFSNYNSTIAKLVAIDNFLFSNQEEYYLVLEKIKKEKENKPFVKLDFSYTKEEFLDIVRSSINSKDFERIKPNISDFAEYFMQKVDCSTIYISIIGSINVLVEYFLISRK